MDIIVIGGGVVGCAVARELTAYQAQVTLLERAPDVATGTSKANSGIVHAGFDAHPGTNKAKFNVLGAKMFGQAAEELDFPFRRCGAFVLNFAPEGNAKLEALLEQGHLNGVEGLKILSGNEVRAMEPNVSSEVVSALYAPTSGIVGPYEMTIAYAENAAHNGAKFELGVTVLSIERKDGRLVVHTDRGDKLADVVVNCAGVNADILHNTACSSKMEIVARKGEYMLLDKSAKMCSATLFQLPTAMGKGVLVSPTVHGNTIVGPTALDTLDKEDVDTTVSGLNTAWAQASLSVPSLNRRTIITQFAGLRAHSTAGDFSVGATDLPGLYECAGIESPGLTSAPAIGKYMAELIAKDNKLPANPSFDPIRKAIPCFSSLSNEERAKLIAQDPAWGRVVCRCEVVTEAEIVEAIHRTPGAKDLDGVKRRVRAGMGRCQAGFCTPRVMEILARELGVPFAEITKKGGDSRLIVGKPKEVDA
ncbi:MAG: NAD(P)/FAD-dependent oxidoreductase [Clostridia bacterium]|nr:NAD(P)/FAD-dependent oxidoreductase [Clostridia bacterium]